VTTMAEYSTIAVADDPAVARITLNRPEKRIRSAR